MRRLFSVVIGCCFLLSACATQPGDTAFQTSTIDALLAGVYDGDTSGSTLLQHGDFGIGTFDHLDGEMLVLDGTIYQIKADGKVYRPNPSIKTPFATVCQFKADESLPIPSGSDFSAVEKLMDIFAPNQNLFYAIKIRGKFQKMKTRSVPGQHKPYPPLKEVTKDQPEFEMEKISGTIVGFRCPPFVKGINVPGYHLHFISDDRSKGGHILSFQIETGTAEIDALDQYVLTLPSSAREFSTLDLSKDRSAELEDVEN